ncbi:MAG: hypothetical protein ABFS12_03755 [Bacteroidota bacterium]
MKHSGFIKAISLLKTITMSRKEIQKGKYKLLQISQQSIKKKINEFKRDQNGV